MYAVYDLLLLQVHASLSIITQLRLGLRFPQSRRRFQGIRLHWQSLHCPWAPRPLSLVDFLIPNIFGCVTHIWGFLFTCHTKLFCSTNVTNISANPNDSSSAVTESISWMNKVGESLMFRPNNKVQVSQICWPLSHCPLLRGCPFGVKGYKQQQERATLRVLCNYRSLLFR